MLDLANPDAYRHVRGQMADLISELGIDYIKWDHILDFTDDEIAQITAFVKLVTELRGLQHAGEVRHADFHHPALRARGVVADDASRAVCLVATVTNLRDVVTERLRPAGLDASRTYRVRLREEIGESRWGWNTPQWIAAARTGEGFAPRRRPCHAVRTSRTARSMCSTWPIRTPTAMCAGRWPT